MLLARRKPIWYIITALPHRRCDPKNKTDQTICYAIFTHATRRVSAPGTDRPLLPSALSGDLCAAHSTYVMPSAHTRDTACICIKADILESVRAVGNCVCVYLLETGLSQPYNLSADDGAPNASLYICTYDEIKSKCT